jgi:hypothetical protein
MWLAGTARPHAEELAAIEEFLQGLEICCASFVSRSDLVVGWVSLTTAQRAFPLSVKL